MTAAIDLLINARWIIPIEPAGTILEHHAVAVADGKIAAVLPQESARTRFPQAGEIVDLPEHVLIPGLINLHGHAAMTLLRGLADDLPLMEWLQKAIWPAESRHLSPAFIRDGTLLAAAEMLAGGITTCNDMYFYPDIAAEAFEQAGMRAVVGLPILEFANAYAQSADDYFRKGLAARDRWSTHPLIRFALAPHAPYTVSDASFERVVSLAEEIDVPIHIHIHETAQEVEESVTRYGMRPLERLARLDVLGSNLIGVHAVHLNERDMDILIKYNCSICHCPSSNMKLASGIAPVMPLIDAGLRVGLGTDSAASNNRLDLFAEMRQAALLAKVSTGDASALPAHDVLRMATLNGAQALGLDEYVGSIAPGKQADLCAVALDRLETQPCYDPASHLVYVAGRENVTHVWVAGQMRINDRQSLLQMNNNELRRSVALWQTKLKI